MIDTNINEIYTNALLGVIDKAKAGLEALKIHPVKFVDAGTCTVDLPVTKDELLMIISLAATALAAGGQT